MYGRSHDCPELLWDGVLGLLISQLLHALVSLSRYHDGLMHCLYPRYVAFSLEFVGTARSDLEVMIEVVSAFHNILRCCFGRT